LPRSSAFWQTPCAFSLLSVKARQYVLLASLGCLKR
jgi:hypothetical protein